MTKMIRGTLTEAGTIDNPAETTITAEYTDKAGTDAPPTLVVTINLPRDLTPGTDWIFDSVLEVDPAEGTITVLCYPNGDDEGWDRLDEVGEW
jgi:hypothetical protein